MSLVQHDLETDLEAVEALHERWRERSREVIRIEVPDPGIDEERRLLDEAIAEVVTIWELSGRPDEVAERIQALPGYERWSADVRRDPETEAEFTKHHNEPSSNLDEGDRSITVATPEPVAGDASDGSGRPSQATMLVELALDTYDLGVTLTGDPYAVPITGPNIARTFRGGRSSLRADLAAAFYRRHRKAPTASALADALSVLEGQAADLDPIEPSLRVGADTDGRIVVDLGDASGRVVLVDRLGYRILEQSPGACQVFCVGSSLLVG